MARLPQPGRLRQLLGLKRVLLVNLGVFAFLAWGFSGEYVRNHRMEQEIDRLRGQADSLEAKNAELTELGKRFATGDMLERQARLKLNLKKPGEEVVVVNGEQDALRQHMEGEDVPDDDANRAPAAPQTNPVRWWHYFFR